MCFWHFWFWNQAAVFKTARAVFKTALQFFGKLRYRTQGTVWQIFSKRSNTQVDRWGILDQWQMLNQGDILGLPGGTALLGALSTQPGRPSTFFLIFFRRLRSQKSRISRVSLPLALFHVYTFTDGHRCMFLFQISSTNTFLCHGRCMLGPTLDIRPSYYFWQ